jgi:hypothetical protein
MGGVEVVAAAGDAGAAIVPGKKELGQLRKRLAKAKKQHAQLQKFTAAENYASRVPSYVQEKDTQRLSSLEAEINHAEQIFRLAESSIVHSSATPQAKSPNEEGEKNEKKGRGRAVSSVRFYPKVERVTDEQSGLYHAQVGNLERLQQLIEHENWNTQVVDKYGTNSLMWAAGYGHLRICKYLTEEGSVVCPLEIESRNKDGRTPLMWALRNGQLEVVEWLVSVGADVNSTNKSGTNMLQWAIWGGHIPAIQYVLDNSALDPRTKNYFGCTAAHWCVSCRLYACTIIVLY